MAKYYQTAEHIRNRVNAHRKRRELQELCRRAFGPYGAFREVRGVYSCGAYQHDPAIVPCTFFVDVVGEDYDKVRAEVAKLADKKERAELS